MYYLGYKFHVDLILWLPSMY